MHKHTRARAHTHILTVTCLISILSGGHRLAEGKTTEAMKILDSVGTQIDEDNPLLPQTSEQFQDMLKLVLHEPEPYIVHRRMLNAVVQLQSSHYLYFKESESMNNKYVWCNVIHESKASYK